MRVCVRFGAFSADQVFLDVCSLLKVNLKITDVHSVCVCACVLLHGVCVTCLIEVVRPSSSSSSSGTVLCDAAVCHCSGLPLLVKQRYCAVAGPVDVVSASLCVEPRSDGRVVKCDH